MFQDEPNESSQDRRRKARRPVGWSAEILISKGRCLRPPRRARILDAGWGGLRVRAWHDAPLGGCLFMHVADKAGLTAYCAAEVVWKREEPVGMVLGLRIRDWVYISEDMSESLKTADRSAEHIDPDDGAW